MLGTSLTLAQIAVLFAAVNSSYYMVKTFAKILAGGVGKNKSSVSVSFSEYFVSRNIQLPLYSS